MNEHERAIDHFISYFRREVDVVSSLTASTKGSSSGAQIELHKKILYSALLDSLAGIRFPSEDLGNRQRFLALLKGHATWCNGNLVSVPVLFERLGPSGSEELRSRLASNLSRYSTERGNSLPLSAFDEPPEVLQVHTNDTAEKAKILKAQHYELFYGYRNFIVHELREPGFAIEILGNEGEEPVYHSCSGSDATWRLLYPENFFKAVAVRSIESLEVYFQEHEINPYERVRESSDWLMGD